MGISKQTSSKKRRLSFTVKNDRIRPSFGFDGNVMPERTAHHDISSHFSNATSFIHPKESLISRNKAFSALAQFLNIPIKQKSHGGEIFVSSDSVFENRLLIPAQGMSNKEK
jgi:hypothetical protein